MDQTILGRTGLKVTIMGIGCGGPSRVGTRTGKTEAESINLIRQGINAGINFIDTAEDYGTEVIVGKAIKSAGRVNLVLSTKVHATGITPMDLERILDNSLKVLGTDYIDIFSLHGVTLENYDYLITEIIPVLQKVRKQGKIRFIGITESGTKDTQHTMLQRALQDKFWDTMMVGFNIINQSAREKNIGIINMYAVRIALSNPEHLKNVIRELIEKKEISPSDIDGYNPLDFLIHDGGATNMIDAAYRFCRYEPGIHIVLSGTGNINHLKANIGSFYRPPLQQEDVSKLKFIFRNVDSVLGN
jgi:L-galactose dehydrogenase